MSPRSKVAFFASTVLAMATGAGVAWSAEPSSDPPMGAYGSAPPPAAGSPEATKDEFGEGAYGNPTTPADELADAPDLSKNDDAAGVYVRATAGATYTPGNNHQWSDPANCPSATVPIPAPTPGDPTATMPYTWAPGCSATQPIGIFVDFRLGYSFGVVGLEGFALGAADWSSGALNGADIPALPIGNLPSYAKDMQIGRIGGGFGGGLRLQTLPGPFRISGGIGGGAMLRHVYSNLSSLSGSSVGYASPMVRADLGLVLLNFFTVGVMGWMEFSQDVALKPDLVGAGVPPQVAGPLEAAIGDITVYQGNQLFLGLFVGLHMGK